MSEARVTESDYIQENDFLKSRIETITKDYESLMSAYKTLKKVHDEEFQKYFSRNTALENENKSLKKKIIDSTFKHAEEIMMLKAEIEELNYKFSEGDYGVPF